MAAPGERELWSPRVIAEVDDAYIKVAKVHGSLAWHSHENEDELFLVLEGHLRIRYVQDNGSCDQLAEEVLQGAYSNNPPTRWIRRDLL